MAMDNAKMNKSGTMRKGIKIHEEIIFLCL